MTVGDTLESSAGEIRPIWVTCEVTVLFVAVLALAMLLTLAALVGGLVCTMLGENFNRKYGNRLMQLRVLAQGVALLLLMAMMVLQW